MHTYLPPKQVIFVGLHLHQAARLPKRHSARTGHDTVSKVACLLPGSCGRNIRARPELPCSALRLRTDLSTCTMPLYVIQHVDLNSCWVDKIDERDYAGTCIGADARSLTGTPGVWHSPTIGRRTIQIGCAFRQALSLATADVIGGWQWAQRMAPQRLRGGGEGGGR